ncbi:MAG: hypothetical protein DCC58_07360 [Chloroflexi bacterium]|nr:MAG: hypothetical protein DCC58_07360 [Chloroflexota bacterium]
MVRLEYISTRRGIYLLRRVLVVLLIVQSSLVALVPSPALGAPPPGFQNTTVLTGLTQPTTLAFTPDGRMLVAERGGTIKLVPAGETAVAATPFLQLTNINIEHGERGLVGLTLDPAFASNGYVYLFYTANVPLRDRVSRFTATGDTVDLHSEAVLWQDNVDAAWWHHGGNLAFGPDGKLYISTGFNDDPAPGSSNGAQRLDSYHGKILRINRDGTVPADNPFVDGSGPNLDAIWARGLRNPFRFSFDPLTGAIYIADVGGGDSSSVEEVNLGLAGANYGWLICEGTCATAGMTDPIFSYPRGNRDASIIGGLVYRGAQFPPEYQGSYFYADYAQNWIRRLTFDANGAVSGSLAFEPTDGTLDGPYGDIVDLKVGPEGALYYVDVALDNTGQQTGPGSIRRISYVEAPFDGTAFDAVWATTDALVASGGASYSWFWGPTVNAERDEPYSESPGGVRRVRYYDKSRMEINDPGGDRSSIFYVTNGLLASELITGRVQRGDARFEQRAPATQLVAGDPSNNPGTPSYATLAPYVTTDGVSNRAPDRTGEPATAFLSGTGALSSTDSRGVTLAHYRSETGHNMASVFWNWANSPNSGLRPDVGVDWVYVLGFPISEPFWIRATVGGTERDVLVQVFERRILTYTPDNPAQYQVEFGNIGQHYLSWISSSPNGLSFSAERTLPRRCSSAMR